MTDHQHRPPQPAEFVTPTDLTGQRHPVPVHDPPPPTPSTRTFREIRDAVEAAEERLLALLDGDEERIGEANELLNELDDLRREHNRRARKQAEDLVDAKVRDRAEREVLARFRGGRPNAHVLKAEIEVRKLGLKPNAKAAQQHEFDEALWRLSVAHGYATVRALDTLAGVAGFREQVVAALRGWEATADEPPRAAAFRFAATKVERMMPTPPDEPAPPPH